MMNVTWYYGLFPLAIAAGCIGLAKWRRTYRSACQMGFPIFHSVFFDNDAYKEEPFSSTGKDTSKLLSIFLRVSKKLTTYRNKPWLSTLKASWVWKMGHQPFEHAGDDSFVLTSLAGNQLWTSDLSVIEDLLEQDRTLDIVLEELQPDSNALTKSVTGRVVNSKQMTEGKRSKDLRLTSNNAMTDQTLRIEAQRRTLALAALWMKQNDSTVSVVTTLTSKLASEILKGAPSGTSSLQRQEDMLGNMLGFFLLFMALYPDIQRKLQEELDAYFSKRAGVNNDKNHPLAIKGDEDDNDIFVLAKGYIGAIQKEILSLYPPVSHVVRRVRPQSLSSSSSSLSLITVTDSKGIRHFIPAGAIVVLDIAAMYRNPRVWWTGNGRPEQSRERRAATADSPALYFNPERWLGKDIVRERLGPEQQRQTLHERALGVTVGLGYNNETSAEQQICDTGKQNVTQVLLAIVVATFFKHYSLELVVDEITLKGCRGMKPLAWDKTRDDGLRMLYEDIEGDKFLSMTEELPVRILVR